jgi:hypothetical protein
MLQPEQATLADNFYFIEKQGPPEDKKQAKMIAMVLNQNTNNEESNGNPFRVRSTSPEMDVMPNYQKPRPYM